MSKRELHLWICDRCRQAFDREEQFRSKYLIRVTDTKLSEAAAPLADMWLCGPCYRHVEGVLKFGKVATEPIPDPDKEGTA